MKSKNLFSKIVVLFSLSFVLIFAALLAISAVTYPIILSIALKNAWLMLLYVTVPIIFPGIAFILVLVVEVTTKALLNEL
jgi:hypothetical protein